MLFIEIFLIRWISTEVRIFAYLSNLALLACFLGIGLGCYYAKKPANVSITIGMLFVIALASQSEPFLRITDVLSGFSDSVVWYSAFKTGGAAMVFYGTLLTMSFFAMILVAFIPLGQILGRIFDEYGNVVIGYSVNILASLAGIWAFNLCSFFSTQPWLWFAFSIATLLFFVPRNRKDMIIAVAALIAAVLVTCTPRSSILTVWSPYQKLELYENALANFSFIRNGYVLKVNNVGYMTLLDQSEGFVKKYPPQIYDVSKRKFNTYELPYQFTDKRDAVLLVGAGGGNDASGALRSGAGIVDGVEIDEGIYKIGRSWHPEKPYDDKRVRIIIDDARAFLKKSKEKYDVISFGVLDSHRISSNFNNMRLDDYVYTQESMREAKARLKDDGVFTLTFYVVPDRLWVGDRIYGLLKKTFGEVPYAFTVSDATLNYAGVMFVTGNDPDGIRRHAESQPDLMEYIKNAQAGFPGTTRLTTDDWPYLYIQKPMIPRLYLLVSAAILCMLFVVYKVLMGSQGAKINLHFFFLGCAFLLLEFQNISKANLLFGSTWIVNSYIISAILLLILAANLFVYFVKVKDIKIIYLLLFLSVVTVYMIPLGALNMFGYWTKSILGATLLNLPIFFAGIIFIMSFDKAQVKDAALGSNLIGAVVGGLLESVSYITGVKALLILVFLLYAASYACLKRSS
jgi:spermidine synthase